MNPLFESTAPPQSKEQDEADYRCFSRAKADNMPLFTLIAQDPTAAPLVALWGDAQRYIRQQLAQGRALQDVLADIERRLSVVFADVENDPEIPEKIAEAYRIAAAMGAWPKKKVAD